MKQYIVDAFTNTAFFGNQGTAVTLDSSKYKNEAKRLLQEALNEVKEIDMSKKIVVITDSPRKNGNSFAMTDAFIQAAVAKGHTVMRSFKSLLQIFSFPSAE